MEASKKSPSLDLVLSIADVFHVMSDYLIRDEIPVDACQAYASGMPKLASETRLRLFGTKLRHLRTLHNLSQTGLAQHLGLSSHAYISFLESSQKEPSIDLIIQLSTHFQVTTDYLLRDDVAVEGIDAQSASNI
jgi:DNA-binding XRE family transcriptional regulator